MKRWTIFLAFVTAVILFQNCSRVRFQSVGPSLGLKFENGQPYSGKPNGHFHRFIPDFTCENREAPKASLKLQGNSATFIENKKLACGTSEQPLEINLIDSSIFQNEIVGYLEGIFEGESIAPSKIPANLVEIWCKDRDDDLGIETVTHFDRVKNEAVNRIYYAANGAIQQIADFPVSRVLDQYAVLVKDGQNFELVVHRDQPTDKVGLFKAHLKAVVGDRVVSQETSCRLGGTLDPRVWPSKEIVDFSTAFFEMSSDLSFFYFNSGNSFLNDDNFFLSNADGSSQQKLTFKGRREGGTPPTILSANRSLIYFEFDNEGSNSSWISQKLMVRNMDFGSTSVLDSGPIFDFKLSPDNSTVVYRVSCTEYYVRLSPFGHGFCLKAVPIKGGSPVVVSPPIGAPSPGVTNYAISRSSKRIVFTCCNFPGTDLYSVNFDGTDLRKINPPMPSSDWSVRAPEIGGVNFRIVGEYVNIAAFQPTNWRVKHFATSIWGTDSIELSQMDQYVSFNLMNASGTTAVLAGAGKNPGQMIPFQLGHLVQLPILDSSYDGYVIDKINFTNLYFTRDSKYLIGRKVLDNRNVQAVAVSSFSGAETLICPEISTSEIFITEGAQNQFYVSTFDQKNQIIKIYKADLTGPCHFLNSAPVTQTQSTRFRSVVLSPDQKKLLIVMAPNSTPGDEISVATQRNQILYMPLDGKPALIVNTPVSSYSTIYKASFANDSRSLIYWGSQIVPTDLNVYLWNAPY